MTGASLAGAVIFAGFVLVVLAVVVVVVVVARSRPQRRALGAPSDDVVPGLMGELRKWQAEAAHWKATAERLQRELDQRGGS